MQTNAEAHTNPESSSSGYRHAYLLIALLLVIVVRPFLSESVLGISLFDILLVITLIAGAFATMASRRWFLVIGLLAVLSGVAQFSWLLLGHEPLLYMFLGSAIAFYLALVIVFLKSLFVESVNITRDTIYSAVSVYLLMGLIWALAYAILELAVPGSFIFAAGDAGPEQSFERFLGFSFTTLTTLGYGNIAPASPKADALTTLEAITGQIYLAIVIARLVGLQIVQRS